MRQFLNNNKSAFRDLKERAKWGCVRFRNQEMPLGCNPSRADIGFEIDNESGAVRLLVTKGIRYRGTNSDVREWVENGEKQFTSYEAMFSWIQGPLGQEFNAQSVTECCSANVSPAMRAVTQITNMAAVQEGIRSTNKPHYIDEAALFERLHRLVLGQDDALRALAAVIVRHCARRSPARPAVVFAVGPSGVGKTHTAEVLAQVFREFAGESNNSFQFLRLDMTEYQEAHRVSQLIGAPQGYIGHGEGSQLVDALRANPNTIVLFDEIEKAHPAILRVLMNAMDAGRLSTASRSTGGHEIDCRHAVFMFTSNIDAKEILDELEIRNAFGNRVIEDDVCRRRLHASGVAPEIVGRIERFLVYKPLNQETHAEIVTLSIVDVAMEYGLQVTYIEPEVIIELLQKSHSQSFGVRPTRYLIDDMLGDSFAKAAEKGILESVEVVGPPYECKQKTTANACLIKEVNY